MNFEQCFDALKALKPYNAMEKCLKASIGINDVVQLEVHITRWQCDRQGKTAYNVGWDLYRVGFELVAVSLLFSGPDAPPPSFVTNTANDNFEF